MENAGVGTEYFNSVVIYPHAPPQKIFILIQKFTYSYFSKYQIILRDMFRTYFY